MSELRFESAVDAHLVLRPGKVTVTMGEPVAPAATASTVGPGAVVTPIPRAAVPAEQAVASDSGWMYVALFAFACLLIVVGFLAYESFSHGHAPAWTPAPQQEETVRPRETVPPQNDVPERPDWQTPDSTKPQARPTGKSWERPQTFKENGVEYTGQSCTRLDGSLGREGYGPKGGLGCWKY